MRVSVDSDDAGYTSPVLGIEIRFNGEAIKHVITADEEDGYVLRCQHQGGEFVLNDAKTDILTEELHGRVEVTMPLMNA